MGASAIHRPLARRLIPDEGAGRLAALAGLAVLGSLILWASAKIAVPCWPVMMSMQSFAVLLLAAAYGSRLGLATVLLYLAEGAVGLPVFQGTPQLGLGLPYMIGPTGGYLVGFVAATWIVGRLAERGADRTVSRLFAAMLFADAVLFLLGFVWLAWFAGMPSGAGGIGPSAAFAGGVLPFLFGDLVKIGLASGLVAAVGQLVRR